MRDYLWTTTATTRLFQALLLLENQGEGENLFRDLFSLRELRWMSRRFLIARLLAQGYNQRYIRQITKASWDQIRRVNLWLNHGLGGYNLILKRLERKLWSKNPKTF